MAVRLGDKCEIRKYMFTLITLNKENPTTQKVVLVMENYHLNQEKFQYLSNLHKTINNLVQNEIIPAKASSNFSVASYS